MLQGRVTLQPLGNHQPEDYGDGVNAIVLAQTGLLNEGNEEGGRDEPLINGKHVGFVSEGMGRVQREA